LELYNITGEDQEDEDMRNLKIPETKGEYGVEVPELEYVIYENPLITHKVNISIEDMLKFTKIGD
jgi:hypothetical protein